MQIRLAHSLFPFMLWRLGWPLLLAACLLASLLVLRPAQLQAADAIVTNAQDSGPGSLRQLIADAAPGDKIVFDESLSGQTIILSATLTIDKVLTIDGSALPSAITLSGNNKIRVMEIQQTATVTLTSFVIADGYTSVFLTGRAYGAGLFNDGTVTVNQLSFVHNQALSTRALSNGGAVYNSHRLIVNNSSFSNNSASFGGGVIVNYGQAAISGSSFTGNASGDYGNGGGYGGAIENQGEMRVENSTFFSNRASSLGGGYGGAIYNAAALTVTNSTFSANIAGINRNSPQNGAILNQGEIWIYNSTFSGNSPPSVKDSNLSYGTPNARSFHLYNTIIANSNGGADCAGMPTTNINTLIEDGSCNATFSGDPLLGPLVDYGGSTLTHALLPGSPAIDAGDDTTCLATDQRGIVRPFDGNSDGAAVCDIGAYEAVIPVLATATSTVTPTPTTSPTPVDTATPTTTGSPTPTATATETATPALTATPTRLITPLPTGDHQFDVRPYVVASANTLQVGEILTVAVTIDNQSVGCVYPVASLTLLQLGDPIFRFDSPATVAEPIGERTLYTLTALTPGSIALQASAYGERYCNDVWRWLYVNGSTGPITVVARQPATPTATATPESSFAVAVTITLSQPTIAIGDTISAVVTVENQSIGCQYPVYDLTLSQPGDTLFRFDSPATVGPPVAAQTVYTLTALAPGTATLTASAYGERNCGNGWQWAYVNGDSAPVTIVSALMQLYLPYIQTK